jgi:myo-inositol-1(or 4)-monophosphatase
VSLEDLPKSLARTALVASLAYGRAVERYSRVELERVVGIGADGTSTMLIDAFVEEAIVEATHTMSVNILSEEVGFVDRGSSQTLVIDPLDGSANAAAGVPLSCFSAALAVDSKFVAALTVWFDGNRCWGATADGSVIVGAPPTGWRTTARREIEGAALSLLRPHDHTWELWQSLTRRAARIRVLSCSTLEAALVLQGSTDAFVDAGSETHRLVDLVAAMVLVPLGGGVVRDLYGRPIEFDTDLTRRWSGVVAASPQLADEICELASLIPTLQPLLRG